MNKATVALTTIATLCCIQSNIALVKYNNDAPVKTEELASIQASEYQVSVEVASGFSLVNSNICLNQTACIFTDGDDVNFDGNIAIINENKYTISPNMVKSTGVYQGESGAYLVAQNNGISGVGQDADALRATVDSAVAYQPLQVTYFDGHQVNPKYELVSFSEQGILFTDGQHEVFIGYYDGPLGGAKFKEMSNTQLDLLESEYTKDDKKLYIYQKDEVNIKILTDADLSDFFNGENHE